MGARTSILLLAGGCLLGVVIFVIVQLMSSTKTGTGTGTKTGTGTGTNTSTGTGTTAGTKTGTSSVVKILAKPASLTVTGWPQTLQVDWATVPNATTYVLSYKIGTVTTTPSAASYNSPTEWLYDAPYATFAPGVPIIFTVVASAAGYQSSSITTTYTPLAPLHSPGAVVTLGVTLTASLSSWPDALVGWTAATDAYYYILDITCPSVDGTSITSLYSQQFPMGSTFVQLSASSTDTFPSDGRTTTFTIHAVNSTGVSPTPYTSKDVLYKPGISLIPDFAYTIDTVNSKIVFTWHAPSGTVSNLSYAVGGSYAAGYAGGSGSLGDLQTGGTVLTASQSLSFFSNQLWLSAAPVNFFVNAMATSGDGTVLAQSAQLAWTTPTNPIATLSYAGNIFASVNGTMTNIGTMTFRTHSSGSVDLDLRGTVVAPSESVLQGTFNGTLVNGTDASFTCGATGYTLTKSGAAFTMVGTPENGDSVASGTISPV